MAEHCLHRARSLVNPLQTPKAPPSCLCCALLRSVHFQEYVTLPRGAGFNFCQLKSPTTARDSETQSRLGGQACG